MKSNQNQNKFTNNLNWIIVQIQLIKIYSVDVLNTLVFFDRAGFETVYAGGLEGR